MRSFTRLLPPPGDARDAEIAIPPLRAARLQLCAALLVPFVGLGAGIAWPWVVAVAALVLLVGLVEAARAAVERGRRRREADEWLLWGATPRPSSALLTWRTDELMSPRLRSTLTHGLRRIEREVHGGTLPGAVPLNRRAIRRHLRLLRGLRERLEDHDRGVSVRGVLLVDRLLTEPGSPLYSSVPDDVLAEALSEALAELDPALTAAAA